jgi:hypothetical protein
VSPDSSHSQSKNDEFFQSTTLPCLCT